MEDSWGRECDIWLCSLGLTGQRTEIHRNGSEWQNPTQQPPLGRAAEEALFWGKANVSYGKKFKECPVKIIGDFVDDGEGFLRSQRKFSRTGWSRRLSQVWG